MIDDISKIESKLMIQGLSFSSSRSSLRKFFLSNQYSESEVESILDLIDKHNTPSPELVSGLYKVRCSDDTLRPSEILALLGIEVKINNVTVEEHKDYIFPKKYYILTIVLSLALATSGWLYFMYYNGSGPFHPASPIVSFDLWP